MERKPYVPPKAEIIMKGRKKMTVKELRDLLYRTGDDDAEVMVEDMPIVNVMLYKDLQTGEEVVRIFT